MTNPVVITRPAAQAGLLAQQVGAIGRDVVIFPLLDILPLTDTSELQAVLNDLGSYAMVSFVSPNAIDASFALHQDWPQHVILSVMGEGSRKALASHGVDATTRTIISPRDPLQTDSQTLLQALDLPSLYGKKVLIIRGESGRELLADQLRAAGVQVTQVAAYRRAAPDLTESVRKQLGQLLHRQNDWVVTSSEALRILVNMARETAGDAGVVEIQHQNIIVPHVRIAETAKALGFHTVVLTGSGDEQILSALQSRP
jgi:uroporphyrinogen-III synthase